MLTTKVPLKEEELLVCPEGFFAPFGVKLMKMIRNCIIWG